MLNYRRTVVAKRHKRKLMSLNVTCTYGALIIFAGTQTDAYDFM